MATNAEHQREHKRRLEEEGRCRIEIKPYIEQKPAFKRLERIALDEPGRFDRVMKKIAKNLF